MENKYILGAGPAGLIAAYYLTDYKIIDKKPLGQLNLPFIPGPRLLQATDNMKEFVKSILPESEIKLEIAVIGFNEDGKVTDSPSKNFKANYAMKTRGIKQSESSFMSEGMTEIEHIEIDEHGEDSYKFLFTTLLNIIKDRGQLIDSAVDKIEPFDKKIFIDGKEFIYTQIVSTLNLNILKKITSSMEDMPHDLSTTKKCFYKAKYKNDLDVMLEEKTHPSLWFDYVYSIGTNWTRQTFFRDYIVYESVDPIEDTHIQGNEIDLKFENLPIQIKESLRIENIDGIYMLGRFAEWDHQIKANEVLDKVKTWIN
tara:strand:+ start:5932 stop:6867 length:936 start_codon:yes stop_codon:yes gene_type:complete